MGIIFKGDPDSDPDLQKNQTLDLYNKLTICPNPLFWLRNHFDNFKDADFRYDNNFLKLQPKKHPDKAVLVSNLRGFFCTKPWNLTN